MEINFGAQNITQLANAVSAEAAIPSNRSNLDTDDSQRTDLLRARPLLLSLNRGLQDIGEQVNKISRSQSDSSGLSRGRSYDVADRLEKIFENLNDLFQDRTFVAGNANTSLFRNPLKASVEAFFGDDDGSAKSIFGLQFDSSSSATRVGQFAEVDRRDLTKALQKGGGKIKEFFAGTNETEGFIEAMENATLKSIAEMNDTLGISSSLIDEFV